MKRSNVALNGSYSIHMVQLARFLYLNLAWHTAACLDVLVMLGLYWALKILQNLVSTISSSYDLFLFLLYSLKFIFY